MSSVLYTPHDSPRRLRPLYYPRFPQPRLVNKYAKELPNIPACWHDWGHPQHMGFVILSVLSPLEPLKHLSFNPAAISFLYGIYFSGLNPHPPSELFHLWTLPGAQPCCKTLGLRSCCLSSLTRYWLHKYSECDIGTFLNQTNMDKLGPTAALPSDFSRDQYNFGLSAVALICTIFRYQHNIFLIVLLSSLCRYKCTCIRNTWNIIYFSDSRENKDPMKRNLCCVLSDMSPQPAEVQRVTRPALFNVQLEPPNLDHFRIVSRSWFWHCIGTCQGGVSTLAFRFPSWQG